MSTPRKTYDWVPETRRRVSVGIYILNYIEEHQGNKGWSRTLRTVPRLHLSWEISVYFFMSVRLSHFHQPRKQKIPFIRCILVERVSKHTNPSRVIKVFYKLSVIKGSRSDVKIKMDNTWINRKTLKFLNRNKSGSITLLKYVNSEVE